MKHTNPLYEPQIISVIAEILKQFNMDFEIFTKTLRSHYVLKVYETCHSYSRTALQCGIDRRIVAAIIKGEKLYNKRPLLNIIIEAVKNTVQRNNGKVAKYGIDSINSIIDRHANGATTLKSVIDVLTESGVIKDNGDSFTFVGYPTTSVHTDQHIQTLITQLTQSINDFKAAKYGINNTIDNAHITKTVH